jgi:dolichyl-phosphate-mannose--protein O-mannosyl transferase
MLTRRYLCTELGVRTLLSFTGYDMFIYATDIAFGSTVTLKNHRTGGNYLHSHWDMYPEDEGIRLQQVLCFKCPDSQSVYLLCFRIVICDTKLYSSSAFAEVYQKLQICIVFVTRFIALCCITLRGLA